MRNDTKFLTAKKISVILILNGVFSITFSFGQKSPNKTQSIKSQTQERLTTRQIVDKVLPSLVVIFAQDKQGKTIGQGSGFVFKQGLVATNLHVFKRASGGFIKIPNSEKRFNITAVVDMDIRHDICVVRIDDRSLPQLPLDETNKLGVGDEVFAFGNPKGLEGSVSKGIISSIRNDLGLIQIDAAISPGSSGGPIVNQQAQVIGIAVSALTSGQNLNFSVPIKYLIALKERFNFPMSVAGVLSVSDLEKEQLKGSVKSYSQEYAEYNYDEAKDKYIEEPLKKMVAMKSFDQFGNVVEEKSYHYGEFAWKYIYSYNDNGFMTKRSYEDFEGKRESWEDPIERVIDLKGRGAILAGTFNTTNGDFFVYDNLGNLTESSIPINTGLWRTVYTYDKNGFEAESKEYQNEKLSKARRYTYELDKFGNWTKRILEEYDSRFPSIGFTPRSIIYRQITYF